MLDNDLWTLGVAVIEAITNLWLPDQIGDPASLWLEAIGEAGTNGFKAVHYASG